MKYYALIDTNVLVSAALKWHSVSGSIVELVFEGYIIPVLNQEIIDEFLMRFIILLKQISRENSVKICEKTSQIYIH